MTYRVIRDSKAGFGDVGLIAIESLDHTTPADSHVLVTVRSYGKPFSYLVTKTDVIPGVNADEFVRGVPQVARTSTIRRILAGLGYGIASLLILALLALGLTGTLAFRVVLTESMQPTINPGDVIVTISDDIVQPAMGDVVVYIAKRFDGSPVAPFAHRIIGGNESEGWIVKGDNNPNADVQHPTADDINAVVVSVWPGVGKLFNTQVLVLIALLILALWFIFSGLRTRGSTGE